jgi:hypothetical protein
MLAIEKTSFMKNKLLIAVMVFGVGFVGSLSTLRLLQPGLGQLSSGLGKAIVPRSGAYSSDTAQSDDKSSTTDQKKDTAAANDSAGGVKPVDPASVASPAAGYTGPSSTSAQPSGSGSIQVSGVMPPTSPSTSTSPVSSPTPTTTTPTAPSTGTVTPPSAPAPSTPSPTLAPVNSLTQPVTDTAGNLLPSLCGC